MQGTKNEWEPLRRRRRRVVIGSIFWPPLAALGVVLFWPHAGAPLIINSAAWVLSFYSAASTPCPRCGESFGSRPITYFRDGSWSISDRRPWDEGPNTRYGAGIGHTYWRFNNPACLNCQLMAYGTFVREGADVDDLPYDVPVPQSTLARFYAWSVPGLSVLLWGAHLHLALAVATPISEFLRVVLGSAILAGTVWTAGYASPMERMAGLCVRGWVVLPTAVVGALLWQGRPDLALSCGLCTVAAWWARGMVSIKA